MESLPTGPKEALEEAYALLESLEGYQHLTERQQNIVRGSLIVQKWADSDLGRQDYTTPALQHVGRTYCSLAVYALEKELDFAEKNPEIDAGFFEGVYETLSTEALQTRIEETGFPCVINISSAKKWDPAELSHIMHTCLALGRDASGEIVIWEKITSGDSYQLTTLSTIQRRYKTNEDPNHAFPLYWSARPLARV